eukprot:628712-Alexandrium_andersonii.AAC.1
MPRDKRHATLTVPHPTSTESRQVLAPRSHMARTPPPCHVTSPVLKMRFVKWRSGAPYYFPAIVLRCQGFKQALAIRGPVALITSS